MDPLASIEADTARPEPPRRKRLWPAFLVVCVISGIGAVLFRLLGPKPVPPPAVIHYTPNQAQAAEQHLNALRDQFLAAPVAPPAPRKVAGTHQVPPRNHPTPKTAEDRDDVRLQLSQADLNAYLTTDPKMKALLAAKGVRAIQIVLCRPRGVVCRAAVLYQGHSANIQIAGNLYPSPKTVLRLEATSAQVGSLPIPAKTVTGEADKLAAALIGRMQGRLPLVVQDVQVVGDRLILTGRRQAPAPLAGT